MLLKRHCMNLTQRGAGQYLVLKPSLQGRSEGATGTYPCVFTTRYCLAPRTKSKVTLTKTFTYKKSRKFVEKDPSHKRNERHHAGPVPILAALGECHYRHIAALRLSGNPFSDCGAHRSVQTFHRRGYRHRRERNVHLRRPQWG